MAQSRTFLSQQIPSSYDRETFARVMAQQDRENTRLTFAAGTGVWNPDDVADGDSVTTTITAVGAVANVLHSVRVFAPYSLQGLIVGAYVSADDTVTITLHNTTGSNVNLGSGTWGVLVENFVLI